MCVCARACACMHAPSVCVHVRMHACAEREREATTEPTEKVQIKLKVGLMEYSASLYDQLQMRKFCDE